MIRVDENVINLVEKLRRAIRNGNISPDIFPMGEINNLMECTLGESFWECIGSQPNDGFQEIPGIYKKCLEKAVERKDMEECGLLMQLFESSYIALYTALSEDEKVFREKPYRKMIIDLGTNNAQMQYRLHQERQKKIPKTAGGALGKGKGAVYTCILGDKKLMQPEEVDAQLDYICFTDNKEKWGTTEGVWQYCAIEDAGDMEERLLESRYKIMPHELLEDYDYSIWVAPDIKVTGNILRFCEIYGEGRRFLGFSSAKEDCIYEDMSVTHMRMDDLNIDIRKKLVRYEKEGYPRHNGLIDSRIMARYHRDKSMCEVMEAWWKEIQDCYSFMGNVFNYIAWKQNFPFSICNLFLYLNPYFKNENIDLETNDDY